MEKSEKLSIWKSTYMRDEARWQEQIDRMDEWEEQYDGRQDITPLTRNGRDDKTPHVRNVTAELVEAQIDSGLPHPKVSPYRKEDEELAATIENMLRNEMDRLPMEEMNDLASRMVIVDGGTFYLCEWDETQKTHTTSGENTLRALHPRQIVPQDGVDTGIEDMDHIFIRLPLTKHYVEQRYNVDLSLETEEKPDIRGEDKNTAEDIVTQVVCYYRNGKGGVGRFSWVNDTVLEDLEDYQQRKMRVCPECGIAETAFIEFQPSGFEIYGDIFAETVEPDERTGKKVCPKCGGTKAVMREVDSEVLSEPMIMHDGTVLPEGTEIPYYKPDLFPIVLQRNVSVYGQLLGDSDVDRISTQQNTINRLSKKILDKLLASGSYMTLPEDATIRVDEDDMKVIKIDRPEKKQLIDVLDLHGDISPDLAAYSQIYEEARQIIGITDSFQGRKDATATSGKAKEFAAAQTAGRLESKRVLKNAAYQRLFEMLFKFRLAYADEPRPVVFNNERGDRQYSEFNRYDFLRRDEAGELYWKDDFLFSCDTSAPLASDRQAMWQETRMNLQEGAFGNPAELDTLILFWGKMQLLHYPGAAETKAYLEDKRDRQMQQMQQMPTGIPTQQAGSSPLTGGAESGIDIAAIQAQARQDAERDTGKSFPMSGDGQDRSLR